MVDNPEEGDIDVEVLSTPKVLRRQSYFSDIVSERSVPQKTPVGRSKKATNTHCCESTVHLTVPQ